MIFSLQGIVQELTPTYAVINVNGVGYYVGISLMTSQRLTLNKETFFARIKLSSRITKE